MLDNPIIQAGKTEFLEKGFQKSSLHHIADMAGVTTGAIYTRYKNKDSFFMSLVSEEIKQFYQACENLSKHYYTAQSYLNIESLLQIMEEEGHFYRDFISSHYEAMKLILCRSHGSQLEYKIQEFLNKKSSQTMDFFHEYLSDETWKMGIRIIMMGQLDQYRNILNHVTDGEDAAGCIDLLNTFYLNGWKKLLSDIGLPHRE